MVQLNAPDINITEPEVLSYSQLFNAVTTFVIKSQGVRDIILALRNVLVSSRNPEIL